MLNVNTIYPAFMGEVNPQGIGALCTFVRLSGCNIRCYKSTLGGTCDTPEALEYGSGKDMTSDEILEEVGKYGYPLVCLTGGEPLSQSQTDLFELLKKLGGKGYTVVVETNGTVPLTPFVGKFRNVFFVVDEKCPSTGETSRMKKGNYPLLREGDFVKFVVKDEKDFSYFLQWYQSHSWSLRGAKISVGLFWGSEIGYLELLELLRENNIKDVHVNMQTHKMMCLYDSSKENLDGIKIPYEL